MDELEELEDLEEDSFDGSKYMLERFQSFSKQEWEELKTLLIDCGMKLTCINEIVDQKNELKLLQKELLELHERCINGYTTKVLRKIIRIIVTYESKSFYAARNNMMDLLNLLVNDDGKYYNDEYWFDRFAETIG